MVFGVPYFLFLLPLAGLPVLFHFLLKQRRRKMVFTTLMFFTRTDPRLRSRRRLREILLLMLRVLMIVLLLGALSRPKLVGSFGAEGSGAVVIVVDNSASMSGFGSDPLKTKFEQARDGARAIIDRLPAGTQAVVFSLVARLGDEREAALTASSSRLQEKVDQIRLSDATGDVAAVLAHASTLIVEEHFEGAIWHILTDGQQAEWNPRALTSKPPPAGVVYTHLIPSRTNGANVSIRSAALPEHEILPGHPCTATLWLHNSGDSTLDVQVSGEDITGHNLWQQLRLRPGVDTPVILTAQPQQAGPYWLSLEVSGDDFTGDNRAGLGLTCRESATVLLAGRPGDYGVLPTALSPSGKGTYTGFVPVYCEAEKLFETAEEIQPVLLVLQWTDLPRLSSRSEQLEAYIQKGGQLLIVANPRRKNPVAGPDWLAARAGPRQAILEGVALQRLDRNADWWPRSALASEALWKSTAAYAWRPLEQMKGYTPLLGMDYSNVVLARKQLGAGSITLSGLAFDPEWTTLTASPLCVLLVQHIATQSLDRTDNEIILTAGETLAGQGLTGAEIEVVGLVGDSLNWRGRPADLGPFDRVGVYLIKNETDKRCVSVIASAREGRREFHAWDNFPQPAGWDVRTLDYGEQADLSRLEVRFHQGRDLYLWLLLLLIAVLFAEGWLANQPRTPSGGTTGRSSSAEPDLRQHRSADQIESRVS